LKKKGNKNKMLMALKKYKLGELIELCDERNTEGITEFYGININKEFMPTVANTEGLDESKYKVVRKNRFVFSGMQTGRDVCIRISMYMKDNPIIVSPAYTTFEVKKTDIVSPTYFFMLFLSKEMDRLGWFCSDGSIRSNLDWDRFCDFDIYLPSLDVQKQYAAVYQAACDNMNVYQSRLDSLKTVCDGFIDKLQKETKPQKIGSFIEICDERNSEGKYTLDFLCGISTDKTFIDTKANMDGVSLQSYKVVNPDDFAYVADTSRRGDKMALAYNDGDIPLLISSIYTTFRVSHPDKLLSGFLAMYFHRLEFDRYARFCSWGSARETFDWNEMCDVEIPITSINIQQDIVNIYQCYIERKRIAAQMKEQIKALCPVLIRGSLQE
jgi:type I restriction enzyme S subunit